MTILHKKSLGQNFLTDKLFLEKIINSSGIESSNNVIEIGPGDGALTTYILEKTQNLVAYEIDQELIGLLTKKFKGHDANFINEDFLEINLNEINTSSLIVVGNLPYNVSSQIILNILESDLEYEHCIFLVQKELAQRFNSTKKSSKISLIADFFSDFEILFDIPPEAFYPSPKVTSSLIKIKKNTKYKDKKESYIAFKRIVSLCFANPRKKISNPLKNIFDVMPKFSFDINCRPQELEIDNYFEILSKYEE
ncbi:MAG: ribosomal RNA small subunit methyltransferase A [Gammaproteobacteria bacterium]|nr:ribosomal RNA small subunit methyltransferase A [Gammaproteobacteria bacterium]|tara:strand:- start:10181 stop:10936 length:756 start_codon:yes stop_codon:yes gene_type:complete